MAMVATVVAAITTYRVYPFIGLADGFSRWRMAIEIIREGRIVTHSLLSPIIPYIQAFTYRMTNSYGLYTWLQCFAFYLAMAIGAYVVTDREVMVSRIHIPIWFLVSAGLLLMPSVRVFPALLTDSAPVFVLMCLLIALVKAEIVPWLKGIFMAGLVALCVSIRVNSLVLFCIWLVVAIFGMIARKRWKWIGVCIGIFAGILLGIQIPRILMPTSYNAVSLGMIWELTSIEEATHDEVLYEELSAYGDVDEAVTRYQDSYLNAIVWNGDPPFPAVSIAGEYAGSIIRTYIKTMIRMPKAFVRNKLHFVGRSLGVTEPLLTTARGIHGVDDVTMSYGATQTEWQLAERSAFISQNDRMSVVSLRPVVLMGISLLLVGAQYFVSGRKIRDGWLVWSTALLYYSSFCINTQAHEFRYYAPSYYLLLLLSLCSALDSVMICVQGREKHDL